MDPFQSPHLIPVNQTHIVVVESLLLYLSSPLSPWKSCLLFCSSSSSSHLLKFSPSLLFNSKKCEDYSMHPFLSHSSPSSTMIIISPSLPLNSCTALYVDADHLLLNFFSPHPLNVILIQASHSFLFHKPLFFSISTPTLKFSLPKSNWSGGRWEKWYQKGERKGCAERWGSSQSSVSHPLISSCLIFQSSILQLIQSTEKKNRRDRHYDGNNMMIALICLPDEQPFFIISKTPTHFYSSSSTSPNNNHH